MVEEDQLSSAPDQAPVPPGDWPEYLRDPIERQDPDTLHEIAEFARRLAAFKERHAEPDDVEPSETDEYVEDVTETTDGFIVVKKQLCGKDGCRCADGDLHGPYRWRVKNTGDGYSWTYLGKAATAE